jgi:hypothetical protein
MATNENGRGQDAETARIKRVADGLGLKVSEPARAGSEANLAGIRSESVLISHRLDSRTWFVQDQPDNPSRSPADNFRGSRQSLLARGREALKILGIPSDEVGEENVLQERTRLAQVDRRGKISRGQEGKGAKILHLGRVVRGCPVWSSNATLRLGKDGRIVFLQVHWPEISDAVLEEASELAHRVKAGWCPPPQEGASPESVEAGVVHSPAAAFVMDVHAVVRVIYEPWNQRYGRKLMLHFDRHGRPVSNPRIGELNDEPERNRQRPEDCK